MKFTMQKHLLSVLLLSLNLGGCVTTEVVDSKGNVTDAQVVKPLGMGLDQNAVATVKTWKFKPALRNGTPVPVKVMVEVSFRLF